MAIKDIKRKLPPEKGERIGKETKDGNHSKEGNEKRRSDTGTKVEKTNELLPIRLKA